MQEPGRVWQGKGGPAGVGIPFVESPGPTAEAGPTAIPSLHDLEMWERRPDGGHVQARIQEIYPESCQQALAQWRNEFARRRSAVDTGLIRLHLQEMERIFQEAVAQVEARSNYDTHDCLHLTVMSPRAGQGS